MSRSLVCNAVERVKRQLASSFRYEVNILDSALSSTATTLSLTYDLPASVIPGAVISIANEAMRVMTVDKVAQTFTVIRGWHGSTQIAHATGSEVLVNPRFSGLDIYEALVDEITSWGPDLYQAKGRVESVSDSQDTINLPLSWRGIYGLIDVRRQWMNEDSTSWPRLGGRLQRGVPGTWTDGPSSGALFRIYPPIRAGSVYLLAAAPFDVESLNWSADLIDDIGLLPSMLDVLDMGIKWRLLGDAEAGRSARVAQDTPRRAEEVPPRAASDEATRIYPLYVRRKQEEVDRLRWQYPLRFT
jgi:hypothetical protein